MGKMLNERKPLKGSSWWGILVFAILILIDQTTKIAAEIFLKDGKEIFILSDWITLKLVYNRGISYGLGDDASPWVKLCVIGATAVIMLILTIAYFCTDKRRGCLRTAFVFVVAGGVGNLIDRLYYKVWEAGGLLGVRDMVNVSRFGFAVCNFADFFITAGAIMLVLSFLFFDRDAFFPVGKYKTLQKEMKDKEEELAKQKEEKKAQKNG